MKLPKEAKIGLLVTSAVAALIYGMNFLKGIDMFTGVHTYYALYSRVDGLTTSGDVLLNGVKVGQIRKIDFLEDRSGNIVATIQVRKDVFVSKGSTARIVSADLLGGRAVEILLGPGTQPANPGDTLFSDMQSTLSDQMLPIKDRAESLLASLDTLAISLNQVFNDDNRKNLNSGLENLEKSLANLESISGSVDNMLASDQGKLKRMIDNIESITSNIRNNNDELNNILSNLSSISDTLAGAGLSKTIENTNAALKQFSSVLDKVSNGEGTIGQLVTNDSLYNALQKSASDLDSLMVDLKANPGRYVHFSVFGKKEKKQKKQ
ncbi:MAG: MlaD family protein [Bacteroidota bacterium]